MVGWDRVPEEGDITGDDKEQSQGRELFQGMKLALNKVGNSGETEMI